MRIGRIAVGALLTGCLIAAHVAAATTPSESQAFVARILAPASVFSTPGGKRVGEIGPIAAWNGGPTVLRVLGERRSEVGTEWVRVLLPTRPNGVSGWVHRDLVTLQSDPWRVVVHRDLHLVSVYRLGHLVRRFHAVIGKPSTPTPRGNFAVYEKVPQPEGGGFLGPWVLHLTAHSTVLENYGGGPGRVAIHGRGGASLADPLGTSRSHGCIRVDNTDIVWLAHVLPVGTPVDIR